MRDPKLLLPPQLLLRFERRNRATPEIDAFALNRVIQINLFSCHLLLLPPWLNASLSYQIFFCHILLTFTLFYSLVPTQMSYRLFGIPSLCYTAYILSIHLFFIPSLFYFSYLLSSIFHPPIHQLLCSHHCPPCNFSITLYHLHTYSKLTNAKQLHNPELN